MIPPTYLTFPSMPITRAGLDGTKTFLFISNIQGSSINILFMKGTGVPISGNLNLSFYIFILFIFPSCV